MTIKLLFKFVLTYFQLARVALKIDRRSEMHRKLRKSKSLSILEIGVHNGHNAVKMINALQPKFPADQIHYVGIDLFELYEEAVTQREISKPPGSSKEVYSFIQKNCPGVNVTLLTGYSSKILPLLNSKFDFIFIDGGHSYETCAKDFALSLHLTNTDTIIAIDDYTNKLAELREGYGIRRLIGELNPQEFKIEKGIFVDLFLKEYGLLSTRIVYVTRH